jgi:hypothetical protein
MAPRGTLLLLLSGLLTPFGMAPAHAQVECPYLTRPLVETENGATRINQWAQGTLLCHQGRMLRCEVGRWLDYGSCPSGPEWQAREAVLLEQRAAPAGVTTPAPPPPAGSAPASPEIDCSDAQRLAFERHFNKSVAEAQRCADQCRDDACKAECKHMHDYVRAPQIMERYHADACTPIWYP